MAILPIPIHDVAALSKRYKAHCTRAKICSVDQLVLSRSEELPARLRLSKDEADHVYRIAARAIAPAPVSLSDLLNGQAPRPQPETPDDAEYPAYAGSSSASSSSAGSPPAIAPLIYSLLATQQHDDGGETVSPRPSGASSSEPDSRASPHRRRNADSSFEGPRDCSLEESERKRGKRRAIEPIPVSATYRDADAYNGPHRPTSQRQRDVLCHGRSHHVLTTGDASLDTLLNGGIFKGLLTEITGERYVDLASAAGDGPTRRPPPTLSLSLSSTVFSHCSTSGKTQLAIQVAVCAALGLRPFDASVDPKASDATPPPVSPRHASADALLAPLLCSAGVADQGVERCSVAYITSDGQSAGRAFVRRAIQVADCMLRKRLRAARQDPSDEAGAGPGPAEPQHHDEEVVLELARRQLLANLHIACVNDVEALDHALKYTLPGLAARLVQGTEGSGDSENAIPAPIGLIVVDSLPPLFHEDPATHSMDSLVQRNRILVEVSDSLKQLAQPAPLARGGAARPSAGAAVVVINHVSDVFGREKDIANRFVFSSSDRLRIARQGVAAAHALLNEGSSPDHPLASATPNRLALPYAEQGAFFSGLLASVPPTLAETLSLYDRDAPPPSSAGGWGGSTQHLYSLQPKTAQLGHVWTNSINVRLLLSKTRGRVSPDSAGGDDGSRGGDDDASHQRPGVSLVQVRRATVVFSACGPSMFDPATSQATGRVKRMRVADRRHVRFVIRQDGVVSLKPYTSLLIETAGSGGGSLKGGEADKGVEEDGGEDTWFETLQLDEEELELLERQLEAGT
ncbi:DNA repair protein rhp57 [Thecaphora frezii]